MAGKTELSYRGGLKVRTAWIYYVWQLPGTPVSIRLSLDVVEQLGLAVVEGFKAIPRRGLEVGGFLLGSLDKRENSTTVSIRAFEPFPSEPREGPSYVL